MLFSFFVAIVMWFDFFTVLLATLTVCIFGVWKNDAGGTAAFLSSAILDGVCHHGGYSLRVTAAQGSGVAYGGSISQGHLFRSLCVVFCFVCVEPKEKETIQVPNDAISLDMACIVVSCGAGMGYVYMF